MPGRDTIAAAIGLTRYAVPGEGIGGMLKARVADFRVEEEIKSISLDVKGRFTVACISLTNWETNRFINRLAKTLRMSRDRIWFAGTKDKRAITRQLFVIDARRERVAEVEIPDVEIEIIGRTHQKIGFGSHRGNIFTVIARGCCDENGKPLSEQDALERVEVIEQQMAEVIGAGLFPNWFGPQRFGAGRPVTSLVGRHVVEGDFEGAVKVYLGLAGVSESNEAEVFRTAIREGVDFSAALEICPERLGFEKTMLSHLIAKPDDWVGAFGRLPRNLQLMTVHALQSEIFNRSLHARLDAGLPLATPLEGDMVAPLDERGSPNLDRTVVTTAETLVRISRNCLLQRLVVVGTLPGNGIELPQGKGGKIESTVISALGLDEIDWLVSAIARLSTKGSRRALVSSFSEFAVDTVPIAEGESLSERWQAGPQEGDVWHPEGACLRFRFKLPPGAYATTFLREFMRVPLRQL